MRMAVPLLAVSETQSAAVIGMLLAMFAAFPFVLAMPIGRLVDRRGYHLPVRLGAALALTGAMLAAWTAQVWALGVAGALVGAGSAMGMIALQRTAGRLARGEAQRLRIFSWVALAPSIATFVGPMAAGLWIDQLGFRAAFVGLALFPLVTGLATLWVPQEALRAASNSTPQQQKAWDLLADPALRRLIFINWLIAACWDAHSFALPILGHERGLSASAIASVLAAYAVTSASVRLAIPLLAERLQPRWVMTGALALTASVFLLYPWLDSAWAMAVCAGTMGLGLGAVQPAVMSSLHSFAPTDRQGEAMGLRSTVIHFSTLVMPLSFGAVGTALGVAPVFWIAGVALSAGAWSAFGLPSRGPHSGQA
ncbi:MAG: MFS transporter [Polaromonas sp.]|nr:MFS transporter [Polaromonas sp.]